MSSSLLAFAGTHGRMVLAPADSDLFVGVPGFSSLLRIFWTDLRFSIFLLMGVSSSCKGLCARWQGGCFLLFFPPLLWASSRGQLKCFFLGKAVTSTESPSLSSFCLSWSTFSLSYSANFSFSKNKQLQNSHLLTDSHKTIVIWVVKVDAFIFVSLPVSFRFFVSIWWIRFCSWFDNMLAHLSLARFEFDRFSIVVDLVS